jgi:hypothetical protein
MGEWPVLLSSDAYTREGSPVCPRVSPIIYDLLGLEASMSESVRFCGMDSMPHW